MKKQNINRNLRLGLFITVGLLIFLAILYIIGKDRNLFSSTMGLHARFSDASGIIKGNNVQYSGIDIGVVDEVKIISDTAIQISFKINEKAAKYIKKDSEVSIGTAGLMGRKILLISSGSSTAGKVEEGDILPVREGVEIKDVLESLKESGRNANTITQNLATLSNKLNEGVGVAGRLMTDTTLEADLEKFMRSLREIEELMVYLKQSGQDLNVLTGDLKTVGYEFRHGDGLAARLISDTALAVQFEQVIDSLEGTSTNLQRFSRDLAGITGRIERGEGTAGKILTDTTMAHRIDTTIIQLQQAIREFEKTMKDYQGGILKNLFF